MGCVIASLVSAISTNLSKDLSEVIWDLTSHLSLMSIPSRSPCFAVYSEIILGGKLFLSVSRVITVSVICSVFPLLICSTASHHSWILSMDLESRKYPSILRLSPLTVLAPGLLSY